MRSTFAIGAMLAALTAYLLLVVQCPSDVPPLVDDGVPEAWDQ